MSAGTPSLVIIGAFVAGLGIGWGARAYYDGSTISAVDATGRAQSAVNASVKSAAQIERAASVADNSRANARKSIEVRYVDRACPPGVGAVSDDVGKRLRDAFKAEAGSDPP